MCTESFLNNRCNIIRKNIESRVQHGSRQGGEDGIVIIQLNRPESDGLISRQKDGLIGRRRDGPAGRKKDYLMSRLSDELISRQSDELISMQSVGLRVSTGQSDGLMSSKPERGSRR